MKLNRFLSIAIVALVCVATEILGHGIVMDPVSRASRWRLDGSTPRDYNDKEGITNRNSCATDY